MELLVTWRQGRCLPYGEGITFRALGEIVEAHAGIYESDSPQVATEKLEAVLPECPDRPWLRARLLTLLGIDSDDPPSHEEAFSAWRRFLEGIAEREPAVLVFEDIHWADESMLAFLEHLADWAEGVPLLILCTARPELYERHETWGSAVRGATTIGLSRLSDADTARLVSALLEQAVLPAETQQLLLERAGGNPLYAEEFVRMLRERSLLNEYGTLEADAEVPFPHSIQALISARLDTLPADRKALLQDAAVIGKVFWTGSLTAMGDRDTREVEIALHELVRKELVRSLRRSSMEGEAEYGFHHLLARDVAYGQIPRADRAGKHLRAAAWLEGKAGERVEDLAEVLAHHTGEALRLARETGDDRLEAEIVPAAARYALLAGERALGLGHHEGARAFRAGPHAHRRVGRRLRGRPAALGRCRPTSGAAAGGGHRPRASDRALPRARRRPRHRRGADDPLQRPLVARRLARRTAADRRGGGYAPGTATGARADCRSGRAGGSPDGSPATAAIRFSSRLLSAALLRV